MRVFVSATDIEGSPAADLVRELRSSGIEVAHSPKPGSDDWGEWYDGGLREALEGCRVFVAVVDEAWDSSSWMGEEADQAHNGPVAVPQRFFWNPERIKVTAKGMTPYLTNELPTGLREAIEAVQRTETA